MICLTTHHIFYVCYRSPTISDYENDSELEDLKEFLGPKTPVFDTPKEGYSAVEILKILLGETPVSKLCTTKPRGVRICALLLLIWLMFPLRCVGGHYL